MNDARLHAAALADRLIYGAPNTFSAEDAATLLHLVPRPHGWRRLALLLPGLTIRGEMPSSSTASASPGFSTVRMPGERRSVDFDLQGRVCLRAGQWRLYHEPAWRPGRTRLRIEQVMNTPSTTGNTAILLFRHGQPLALHQMRGITLPLGPFHISLRHQAPWKTPA